MAVLQAFEDKSEEKKFGLEVFWTSQVSILNGGECPNPLTPKERRQLKVLANRWGSLTRELIVCAVTNWDSFTSEVQDEYEPSSYPTEPHIGFLLKYSPIAFAMIDEATMPPSVVEQFKKFLYS